MKITKIMASVLVTAAFIAAPLVTTSQPVSAQTPDNCSVDAEYPAHDRNFDVNGTKITGKFVVEGNANCTQNVVLAVWDTVKYGGHPMDQQVLFSHAVMENVGVGTHRITADLPVCENNPDVITFYQADMLRGTNPTTADGTPNYATEPGRMMDWKFGGQDCPEPVVEVVTEEVEVVKEVEVTRTLPNTGIGNVFAIGSIVGLAGGVAHNLRTRLKK